MGLDLTTVARFKTYYSNTPSTAVPLSITGDDELIQEIIDGVSQDILSFLGRKTMLRHTCNENYDGTGGTQLTLRQFPVLAVNSMSIFSYAQQSAVYPNSGYFADIWDGLPPGRNGLVSIINGGQFYPYAPNSYSCFPRGKRNINVNYAAGYGVMNEAATVGTAAPYTVQALQQYGNWFQDDGVTYSVSGAALAKVTAGPGTGQYAVNAGQYQFSSGDSGAAVLLNYSFVPATVEKAAIKMVGEEYAYRQRIGQKSHSIAGNTVATFDTSIQTGAILKALQPFKTVVPI